MKILCYDPKKQKNVVAGHYNETLKTFFKEVTKRHWMILEKGYGIQDIVLQQLKELGCEKICIKTKLSYINSDLKDWLNQPIKNYGHGDQRFLRIK